MHDIGEVSRATFIVLKAHGVGVSDKGDGVWLLVKQGIIETRFLHNDVSKKTLHYFQRKFDIPIHHFYNPQMATGTFGSAPAPKIVPKRVEKP
jgi:hypothetical protein